ncbi:NAD(P)H-binding protein [Devosia riboflavina]|uniref:NAD(P)H-binding protein n=1 Tax=Devosia riboflavina TaxID=46914 RepID=UPI0013623520|nr:NAD(P)H-binding protein [Devosia riboflavina]
MTKIAVSGASGKLGQLVVATLLERGVRDVVALSRSPERIVGDRRLEKRFADFDEPQSLEVALADVSRLVLISTDALGADGRRVRQHRAAIEAAERAGVEHVVYTSMLHAGVSPLKMMVADHWATELVLAESGLGHTVLRHAFYDDLAKGILARAASGVFPHAAGAGRVAYVSRRQCALAAAIAVSDGFVGRRRFDITGPEALGMDELAELAGRQRGSDYRAEAMSREELVARLVSGGMPEMQAQVMAMIDVGIAAGAMEPASGDLSTLTGIQALPLEL